MRISILVSGLLLVVLGVGPGMPPVSIFLTAGGFAIVLIGIAANRLCRRFPGASLALLCGYGLVLMLSDEVHENTLLLLGARSLQATAMALLAFADYKILRSYRAVC